MKNVAVKLNKMFDTEKLQLSYYLLRDKASILPAGYAGEGHEKWNSITVYSKYSKKPHLLSSESYIKEILSEIHLDVILVRFMLLEPNGVIDKHSDTFLSDQIVRLHIPIITSSKFEFFIDDVKCCWLSGEFWYGDFSLPHYGVNNDDQTRVHLVMDVIADDNFLALFSDSQVPEKIIKSLNNAKQFSHNNKEISKYFVDFVLPKDFHLSGTHYNKLEHDVSGYIRQLGDKLCVFINDQPLISAVPSSADTIELIGMPNKILLHYVTRDNLVTELVLSANGSDIRLNLS